jgi:hypothetical protein
MELCPDFGNFLAKIVSVAGNVDLAHSLRFTRRRVWAAGA